MKEINLNSNFGEYNDVIVDETLLSDTEPVQGLVLLRDIIEGTSKNGTDILRLYCMGKHGGTIQCNYMMYRKNDTTSQDLLEFKNKIIMIEGTTSVFKNMFIVDLKNAPISVNSKDIRPIDFFTPLPEIIEELNEFENNILFIEKDNELANYTANYRALNITSIIQKGLLANVVSYSGDALKLVNSVCGTIKSICYEIDERTLREVMLVTILYVSLDTYLNDKLRVNKSLIVNDLTRNLLECNKIITTHNLLNSKLKKEFFNIYECLNCNKEAKTLTSKLLVNLIPSITMSILATRMEVKVKSGNKINVLGIEHIKL